MRSLVCTLLLAAVAVSGMAQEGFSLGLEELPIATEAAADNPLGPVGDGLSIGLREPAARSLDNDLVYTAALKPRTESEFRLTLWNSDMGRLHYDRAAQRSMLGREGLVNGGRMEGLGMATGALGDGDPGGLQLLVKQKSWKGLTRGDKFRAGVEASFLAAILYYMADNID